MVEEYVAKAEEANDEEDDEAEVGKMKEQWLRRPRPSGLSM